MNRTTKILAIGITVLLAAAAGLGAWFAHYSHDRRSFDRYPVEFSISEGSSLRTVAEKLGRAGIVEHPLAFVLLGRVQGQAAQIKAGDYEIKQAISPIELLQKIAAGDVAQRSITFVEGWTFRDMRKALDIHEGLRHETTAMSDQQILALIGAEESHPEGLFFPDTYHFSKGSSDVAVLKRAYLKMKTHLAEHWAKRSADVPFKDPYEALIFASIVEKETGAEPDRPLVAAVFINRLRHNMLLQTDPSVIYGLGETFDGNLRKRDLLADGPYNTYTRPGLPPTPIAMPGLASLQATFEPARSAALYFVSRGDGTSEFSETLTEHNRAVTKYQKTPRQHQ